jgi:hypothetical protein
VNHNFRGNGDGTFALAPEREIAMSTLFYFIMRVVIARRTAKAMQRTYH